MKMLSNKGFSAKEFFLVFIVIAILSLGIFPVVFRVIESSRNSIVTDSVIIFRRQVNKEILLYVSDGNEILDGCYVITNDGNLCLGNTKHDGFCVDDALTIDINGVKPEGGVVDITENRVNNIYNIFIDNKYVNIRDNEYYISNNPEAEIVCN